MDALKVIAVLGFLAALLAASTLGPAASRDTDPMVLRVANAEDLLSRAEKGGMGAPATRSYVVALPASDLVVIVRPIPREEYSSYQVRAVSYDIIEHEMLSSALVSPTLDVGEIASLPASLVAFLRGVVSDLSGYEVFSSR
jgi:hypothetical protein